MGRKTWESLPKRPLPGRRNIVVSRNPAYKADGAELAESVECALAMCPPPEIPVIMGGGSIYKAALPYCTRLEITRIDADFPQADTLFPEIPENEWELSAHSEIMTSEKSGLSFSFQTLRRKSQS